MYSSAFNLLLRSRRPLCALACAAKGGLASTGGGSAARFHTKLNEHSRPLRSAVQLKADLTPPVLLNLPRRCERQSTAPLCTSSCVRSEVESITYVEDWKENLRQTEGVDPYKGLRADDGSWYSGIHPSECETFHDGVLYAPNQYDISSNSREQLLKVFQTMWCLSDELFGSLNGEEAFYRPPYHGLRHPMIFYYGHVASLYVDKMRCSGLLSKPVNEYFEALFETGVDEMTWDDMNKNHCKWPSIEEVRQYRKQVFEIVSDIILRHPAFDTFSSELSKNPFWAVVMGIDHEGIHMETSSVLIRELPAHLVQRPRYLSLYHPSAYTGEGQLVPGEYPGNEMIQVDRSHVKIGKPRDFPSFGWDNEYGSAEVDVPKFRASKYMISNAEFYQFVQDDGYLRAEFWSKDGWGWRSYRNVKAPAFWKRTGPHGLHQYKLRAVFDVIDMPWNWPVEVNFHEAKAYCHWRAVQDGVPEYRVTTEAEHNVLLDSNRNEDAITKYNGREFVSAAGKNLNLHWTSASPVDALPPSNQGFHDVMGNVWRHCEDHFCPLPGFEVHPIYNDFSLPCFDGKHHEQLGGSFFSTGDEASVFARFHFRPHFLQHAGFRLVEPSEVLRTVCMDSRGPYAGESSPYRAFVSVSEESSKSAEKYDDQSVLNQYLAMHYFDFEEGQSGGNDGVALFADFLPKSALQFPLECARLLSETCLENNVELDNVLDVGCAVGGSSFELIRLGAKKVTGIDISSQFIDAAKYLKEHRKLEYMYKVEGNIAESRVARLDTGYSPRFSVENVHFEVEDALNLPPVYCNFDALLAANLVCRLPRPEIFVSRLKTLVREGGIVVLVSPYSWLPQHCPPENWIGGTGSAGRSWRALKAMLEKDFVYIGDENIPFAIPEHSRKSEFVVSHAMKLRRKHDHE